MENHKDCSDNCGEIASQRMLYFPGRYMSARDFTDEQKYFLTRRYLHNRILHGWGVVCGLHVYPHPSEGCRKDHVKVDCGIGLDCCGHEVVVPKAAVPPAIPWEDRPTPQPADAAAGGHGGEKWYPLLCLEYCETEIECVPVLYSERNCDKERQEFSRISEGYRFCWHWARRSDLTKYHWKHRGGCPPHAHADGKPGPCPDDDCYEAGKESGHCCLEPDCPPDHCLPLAWIRSDGEGPIGEEQIVTLGRPALQPPAHSLTHICSINWPHGGTVSRRHLEQHLRRLEIRFDRRLRPSETETGEAGPRGVNPATFVVQFGGGYEDLDFVTYEEAPHVENDCVAVFTIDPRSQHHHQLPYTYLENQYVYITVKCDFVLDCHGVAVDGNHLGGILPSGDGVPGGTFESWFQVLPEHEWERQEQERQKMREERR